MAQHPRRFASRAGEKLDAALEAFGIDVGGAVCADLGANVGGFTDCLLRRGSAKVYAVDTGYGELAWRLRTDDRVVVMERTNALYCRIPEPVDLVAVDVAWTPQERILPAALRWLNVSGPRPPLGVISLLKPHYELAKMEGKTPHAPLAAARADAVCLAVSRRLAEIGIHMRAAMRSVLPGKGGNREYLLWVGGTNGPGNASDNNKQAVDGG